MSSSTSRRSPTDRSGAPFAGQGLVPQLVQQALDDVRASGMRIVPVCPYVAKFLRRHLIW
ncbi:N-acetyltransferase [Streptomyces sp. B93]|nr:N-acetyltransferase [Streptomyces sp. B93]